VLARPREKSLEFIMRSPGPDDREDRQWLAIVSMGSNLRLPLEPLAEECWRIWLNSLQFRDLPPVLEVPPLDFVVGSGPRMEPVHFGALLAAVGVVASRVSRDTIQSG
jgi:hypothetical protein